MTTSRVLFEGPTDKRRPIRVYVDRVDEAPAELLPDVEVAELGAPDGAALFDFVRHLHAHVLAVHADLHFVHYVGDGFHRIGHVAVAKFLLRRNQAHALLEEFSLRDGCVGEISEDTGAHVDDDVLHLGVLVDVAHHLLELGPLCDGLRGLAGLDKLARNRRLELAHLP
ncbi:hypothetical protein A4X17_05590 [Plantibacter sp. H53]|nr:hypothetical protein [Plantibacter sp. H53]OAN29053.1 hypothetical protein A4X17_05590 [Plantibacter sp. H53]